MTETRDEWLARKTAKGVFGDRHLLRVSGRGGFTPKRGIRVRETKTGITIEGRRGHCPCGTCGHELCWDCDPHGGQAGQPTGCKCCDETCS